MNIDTILEWLPQDPLIGPPLPMWMDIHWHPVPEEEAPPKILPLEVPRPLKRYVSKVIVKRVRCR